MDAAAAAQINIGKEIEKIANSYYADKPDRKTLSYLKEKVRKLDELWQQFEEDDDNLRQKYSEHVYHSYYTSDYFNKVSNVYDKLRQEIEQLIKDVEYHKRDENIAHTSQISQEKGNVNKENEKSSQEEVLKLIRNQKRLIATLQKIIANINTITQIQSREYYKQKREMIQKYWNEIEECHKIIWEKMDDPTEYGYTLEQFIELQENFGDILIKFAQEESHTSNYQEQVDQNNMQSHNELYLATPMMQLPKIQLPKFDGNHLQWQQFHDLFTQMVHCQPMSNAQKMFYLKSNLVGEAERLIRHITVSNNNYQTAWDILKERYSNKRLLVSALIDKMLSQPTITNESAASIKTMHDTTKECIAGLENLGLRIYGYWDAIILHILTRKLDRNTHNLYEQSLKAPRELQSVKQFLEVLELRFQALEALGHKGYSEKYKQVKVT